MHGCWYVGSLPRLVTITYGIQNGGHYLPWEGISARRAISLSGMVENAIFFYLHLNIQHANKHHTSQLIYWDSYSCGIILLPYTKYHDVIVCFPAISFRSIEIVVVQFWYWSKGCFEMFFSRLIWKGPRQHSPMLLIKLYLKWTPFTNMV